MEPEESQYSKSNSGQQEQSKRHYNSGFEIVLIRERHMDQQ